MTPIDVRPDHLRIVREVLHRHLPVGVKVWVFGSRASWTTKDSSDLDLALDGETEIPRRSLSALEEAFEDSDLPYTVDVVDLKRIGERFRRIVTKQRAPLPERIHEDIERDRMAPVEGARDVQRTDRSTEMSPPIEKGTRNRRRRDGWKKYAVRELLDSGALEIGDGYRAKNSELSNSGLPFARAGNIRDGFQFDDADCFSAENLDRVKNKASMPGDVVFTSKGTVGRFASVQRDTPRFVYSPQLCFWRSLNTGLIDPRFLYCWMSGREFFEQFKEVSGQTDMAEFVSLRDQRNMRITLPPISEQRAIADVLGTLDDKIELNRRMNATLEAMARALFKSWFVDFDPVRAKMEGRDPGLPKGIADLFPDRLVDSAIGKIPQGWKAGRLADIAIAPGRNVDPASLDDQTPYIGLEHMPRRSIALTGWESVGKVTSNKSIFKRGEVLFGKLRPYFHKVGVAPINGVCSTDIVVISSKSAEWSAFALACTSSAEFVSYTNQSSTGTRMPRTNWTTMRDYRVCLPAAPVLGAFENALRPMLEQIITNVHDCGTLAGIRDALLPKLISGEMRVRDAEKVAGVVA